MIQVSKLEAKVKVNKPDGTIGVSTYEGGRYCGPGWGFTKAQAEAGWIGPKGVDAIDEACRAHDICYGTHGYLTQSCNIALTRDLSRIVKAPDSTPQMRIDAAIMAGIFALEAATIDEKVKDYREWRKKIESYWRVGKTMQQVIRLILSETSDQ